MPRIRSALALLMLGNAAPLFAAPHAPVTCTTAERLPLGQIWQTKSRTPASAITIGKLYRTAQTSSGYSITVKRADRYRVATDKKVWIELSRDGASITSTSHQRAATCSGIHKIVDFNLQPGHYALSFKDSADADVKFIIVRAR